MSPSLERLRGALGPRALADDEGGLTLIPADAADLARMLRTLASQDAKLGPGVHLSREVFAAVGPLNSRAALLTAGAGVPLKTLEAFANEADLTLGPLSPAAMALTLGEFLEGPYAGLRQVPMGRLEPISAALEVMLPDGERYVSHPAPRSAAGPDLDALWLGGEGRMGLVLGATVRLLPRPTTRARADYAFPLPRPTTSKMVDHVAVHVHVHVHDNDNDNVNVNDNDNVDDQRPRPRDAERSTWTTSTAPPAPALVRGVRLMLESGANVARGALAHEGGRFVLTLEVEGTVDSVERDLASLALWADRAGGGPCTAAAAAEQPALDGEERELDWEEAAALVGRGGTLALYRPSVASVIVRGAGEGGRSLAAGVWPDDGPLARIARALDSSQVLGGIP